MIRVKSLPLAIGGVAILLGGIFGARLLGYWKTESTKEPAKIKTGEFAGKPNPSDIRGSYTWLDVEKAFGIPVEELTAAFQAASAGDKVNTLEALWAGKLPEGYEIGTDSVRLFVALYTGLPHEAEEGTLLPLPAIDILAKSGKADPALLSRYRSRIAAPGSAAAPSPSPKPAASAQAAATASSPKPAASPSAADKKPTEQKASASTAPAASAASATAEHASSPGSLTGSTTFGELKAWGAAEADIKEILGGGIGRDDEVIKDYVSAKGLKFGEVKTRLQELVRP